MSEFIDKLLDDVKAQQERRDREAVEAREKDQALWANLRAWWTPFATRLTVLIDEWNSKVDAGQKVALTQPKGRTQIQLSHQAFDQTYELEPDRITAKGRMGNVSDGQAREFFHLSPTATGVRATRGAASILTPEAAAEVVLDLLLRRAAAND